jgi:hypothetical protein
MLNPEHEALDVGEADHIPGESAVAACFLGLVNNANMNVVGYDARKSLEGSHQSLSSTLPCILVSCWSKGPDRGR